MKKNPELVFRASSLASVRYPAGRYTLRPLITYTEPELSHWHKSGETTFALVEDMNKYSVYSPPGTHGIIMSLQGEVELHDRHEVAVISIKPGECTSYTAYLNAPLRLVATQRETRILCFANTIEGVIEKTVVQTKLVSEVPITERKLGIKLRSLWRHFDLPGNIGLEYVELDGIAPRHAHLRSDAVCHVRQGQGFYGCDVGNLRIITPVAEGDVIYIPAERYHGFHGLPGFVFDTAQVEDIADDYVVDGRDEYDYMP